MLGEHLEIPNQAYRAYLLRLWRDEPGAPWRALLRDVQTGRRHGFSDLESLCAFLQAQACEDEDRKTNET